MKDSIMGWNPVFWTKSEKIVEEMLKLDDLQVRARDGEPLLRRCALKGMVSERMASDRKLAGQYGQRYEGRLPLEEGEHEQNNWNWLYSQKCYMAEYGAAQPNRRNISIFRLVFLDLT